MASMAAAERLPEWVGVSLPSDPTYIGSRHTEIETMLEDRLPRFLNRGLHSAPVAAGAGRPVADDSERVAARQVGEPPDLDRLDLDAVEHTRQCRLQRWQEQR